MLRESELISQHVEEVKAVVDDLAVATAAGSGHAAEEQNLFRPAIDVPENPPHVVLDFLSTSELEGGASRSGTIGGKLRSVVMLGDVLQSIWAIRSALTRAVVTGGMSGVGKSCALRGLAEDHVVRRRFRHGIYYTFLGKDATKQRLFNSSPRRSRLAVDVELGRRF